MADNKENITDLTEKNGAPAAGGGAKNKTEKRPKPPKSAKTKAAKLAKGNKNSTGKPKRKKGKIILFSILGLLVILIAGFIFEEISWNYLGTRDVFLDFVNRIDPEYKETVHLTVERNEAALDKREADLEELKVSLDTRKTELDEREQSLKSLEADTNAGFDRRRTQLDKLETELKAREDRLTPIYRTPMSEEALADMTSLSKTYSAMTPEAAADILANIYDAQDVAAILYYMSEKSAGAILSVMDAELAAEVTEILIHN